MKICHLTSVHPRFDTRIFIKECSSLAKAGYDVSLVVADGNGNEVKNDIQIYDVGQLKGRVNRIFRTTRQVFDKAIALNADVYHLHDPELIPAGLKLKKLSKRVIFDSHEDISKQMLSKPYLDRLSLLFLSKMFSVYEGFTYKKFDAIIAATPFIQDKLSSINSSTININNFPILGELYRPISTMDKERAVCYIGVIAAIRGIKELVQAMALVDGKLYLAGKFTDSALRAEVEALPGWAKVIECGFVDRAGAADILSKARAGLVTLHPTVNYLDSLPVKMFEYMSASVAVIGSNFPLWCKILQGNQCGLNVDPLDPKAIALAINNLLDNPEKAHHLGQNGYRAVQTKYNWSIEEQKLLSLYQTLADQ